MESSPASGLSSVFQLFLQSGRIFAGEKAPWGKAQADDRMRQKGASMHQKGHFAPKARLPLNPVPALELPMSSRLWHARCPLTIIRALI